MNVIDFTIVRIIGEPYQKIDEEYCCWAIDVVTECYGQYTTVTCMEITKTGINKYKVGYT